METVEIGTIFVCSWGYDQTNIDYYQVVEFTPSGKSVRIRRICKRAHDGDRVLPVKDAFLSGKIIDKGDIMTKRLMRFDSGTAYLSLSAYRTAFVWNGNSQYETPFGFGH
jgi:hypothetical protein